MTLRRDFLSMTAGAVAARTVLPIGARAEGRDESPIPATNPDAELIAICAEFDQCERQTCIIHGSGPDCVRDDNEAFVASAPFFDRMGVLLDRMNELRATTPAGIQARAHSLAQHGGHFEYDFGCQATIVGKLLLYLLRDSAALGGPPPSTAVSSESWADAENSMSGRIKA